MKRWGPWTQGQLNRLQYDVRGYFRAYYSELRRLMAEHEDADIPDWFGGGRQIDTCACTDGVAIIHSPFDLESMTYAERPDAYNFALSAVYGYSVGEMVRDRNSPTFGDGSKLEVMPAYAPGEDFGTFVRLWPAYMYSHDLPDGREFGIISQWTRLDAASKSSVGLWRDKSLARREAWEALRPYVEDWDHPPLHREALV